MKIWLLVTYLVFVFIAFTYLHRLPVNLPHPSLRVLSSSLFSLPFCLLSLIYRQRLSRGISGLVERFGSIASSFRQVFTLSSFTVVNSSYSKIRKSTLDAFLIYSFYFLHITSVNPALSILFIFSPSLYLFSSLFHSLYSLYYNIYSILPCYLSSSTYHLCHYPIFSSFLYSIFYIFYYKY